MALRYMDQGDYDRAIDLWIGLSEKQRTVRMVSPAFWRCAFVYHYNIALCSLLSGNIIRAKSYAKKALDSIQRGGEALLVLYLCALYARIHKSSGDEQVYRREYLAINTACMLLRRFYGFAFTADDLLSSTVGLNSL